VGEKFEVTPLRIPRKERRDDFFGLGRIIKVKSDYVPQVK
jgi:hypothetical protein